MMATNRNWQTIKEYEDIRFEFFEGIAKITINRPKVRNAFRPQTVNDMIDAMHISRENNDINIVVFILAIFRLFMGGGIF